MKTKLTLLLLISIFIFGCKESDPHVGKWHVSHDNGITDISLVLEILESGNFILHNEDGVETGQWFAAHVGIVMTINGENITAFLHEGSLLVTEEDETHTLKRVN